MYGEISYLLLHLPNLEIIPTQLAIIHILLTILLPGLNNRLHLSDQRPTSIGDSLAALLQPLLSLRHERRLDSRRSDKLCSRSRNVVRGHDELLRRVTGADDAIRSLDEHISRARDGFGGGDETLSPPVVLLVELRLTHTRATALLHDLLLRCRCRFDELGDSVRNSNCSLEDRIVDLELVSRVLIARLVHEFGEFLCSGLDRLRRVRHFSVDNVAQISRLRSQLRLRREGIGKF